MQDSIHVFISYVHEDERLRKKLETHLGLLQHEGLITTWHDRNITAGTEWMSEIHDHLNASQIILLLVSAPFLASDYCYSIEMARALERHEKGDACVIPIILRPVDWARAPFSKLQALPTNAHPVTSREWQNVDAALTDVLQGIRRVIQGLQARKRTKIITALRASEHSHYEYDVALSYASEDRHRAEALAHLLTHYGMRVFYDQYEKAALWGKDLYAHLSDVYQNKAHYCLLLLSQHYASKIWTKHELMSAQERAMRENREYLLPVRLEDVDLPGFLPTTAYLSWPPENEETIAETLLDKMSQKSTSFIDDEYVKSADFQNVIDKYSSKSPELLREEKSFKELRLVASKLLAQKDYGCAVKLLQDLSFPDIPRSQRWRLAALRGQCYFEQRQFLKAQHDFVYAVDEQPQLSGLLPEQKQELLLLHLHLAGAYRELRQHDAALEQYTITLNYINSDTPFGYVAEVHWGLALIAHTQSNQMLSITQRSTMMKEMHLRTALEHAETARFLYRSIGERVRADTVTCHIAQIELKLGDIDKVRRYLQEVLVTWTPTLDDLPTNTTRDKCQEQAIANIVSSAAYVLADIELEAHHFDQALIYSKQALEAGIRSYRLRRADAYLLRGRILEAINFRDPEVEQAFRIATEELKETDRIAARISAHVRLAQHLLKIGKGAEGERQLEQARLLSDRVSVSSLPSTEAED